MSIAPQFYHFEHPDYETDSEFNRRNPIVVSETHIIPLFDCPSCGQPRSSTRNIRKGFDPRALSQFIRTKPISRLPMDEWMRERPRWARELGVPEDMIEPGEWLGAPNVTLNSQPASDFVFGAIPGTVLAGMRVVNLLREIEASGIDFLAVNPTWSEAARRTDEPPQLWLLLVTGNIWRIGVFKDDMIVCATCGRKKPSVQAERAAMKIDTDRSDDTDFFTREENPHRIYITARICKAFQAAKLTNYRCREASLTRHDK